MKQFTTLAFVMVAGLLHAANPSFQDTTNIVDSMFITNAGNTNLGIYSSVLATNWKSSPGSFSTTSDASPVSVTLPAGKYSYVSRFYAVGGDTNGIGIGYRVSGYPSVLLDVTTYGPNGSALVASVSQYPGYAPSGIGGFYGVTGSVVPYISISSGSFISTSNLTFTVIGGGITTGRTGVTFYAGSGVVFRKIAK